MLKQCFSNLFTQLIYQFCSVLCICFWLGGSACHFNSIILERIVTCDLVRETGASDTHRAPMLSGILAVDFMIREAWNLDRTQGIAQWDAPFWELSVDTTSFDDTSLCVDVGKVALKSNVAWLHIVAGADCFEDATSSN